MLFIAYIWVITQKVLKSAKKPPKFFERFRMIIDLNYHKGLDDRHLLRLTGQN